MYQLDIDDNEGVSLLGCESHDGVTPNDDDLKICFDLDVFNNLNPRDFKKIQNFSRSKARGLWLDKILRFLHPYQPKILDRAQPTKKAIPGNFRWSVFERDQFTCQKCGSHRNLTVDHIVPESKGGELTMDNAQTLCKSCNSRKGAR
jgi:hypothetical protein